MKAVETYLTDYLEGANTKFRIPIYQRNYSWNTKDQCQQLWDDLVFINNENKRNHFFGSIVTASDPSGDKTRIVIDGQQRLTTITLLLAAIVNKSKIFKQKDPKTPTPNIEEIENLYLGKRNKDQKLKLKLTKDDMHSFEQVCKGNPVSNLNSNISKNYNFFYEKINPGNVFSTYEAIKKLQIVDISITPEDSDPQLIFESLNDYGLNLTDADKIRNFILMNITDEATQEELHNQYWSEIENNSGLQDAEATTKFIRYYLMFVTNTVPAKEGVYKAFKEYTKSKELPIRTLLADMLKYSEIYRKIIQQSFNDNEINFHITRILEDLHTTVTIPFFFDVFEKFDSSEISKNDVITILEIIESYFLRRSVCKERTASLDKFFNSIIVRINNLRGRYNSSYLDLFIYTIMTESNYVFPNDKDFETALLRNPIYSYIPKLCKYILLTIENYGNKKERVNSGYLTVEHIMPQSTPKNTHWQNYLGMDWKRIYDENIDTLGNLTLTGYNSEYSNKPFEIKKTMENGFNKSPLILNQTIAQTDSWNETAMKTRGQELTKRALLCWPSYSYNGNYSYNEDNYYSLYLDGDIAIAQGKKPERAELQGETIFANSWKFLYSEIINALYTKHQARMQQAFDFGNQGKFSNIISKKEEKRGLHGEILWEQLIDGNDIYFYVNKSATDFLTTLKIWFDFLNIDLNDLKIYFQKK